MDRRLSKCPDPVTLARSSSEDNLKKKKKKSKSDRAFITWTYKSSRWAQTRIKGNGFASVEWRSRTIWDSQKRAPLRHHQRSAIRPLIPPLQGQNSWGAPRPGCQAWENTAIDGGGLTRPPFTARIGLPAGHPDCPPPPRYICDARRDS